MRSIAKNIFVFYQLMPSYVPMVLTITQIKYSFLSLRLREMRLLVIPFNIGDNVFKLTNDYWLTNDSKWSVTQNSIELIEQLVILFC